MKNPVPTITTWQVARKSHEFHVRINGVQRYERKEPYRFWIDMAGGKILTNESIRFGILYGQICYVIRESYQKKEAVTRAVRLFKKAPEKKTKKRIPASAHIHELLGNLAGACGDNDD